MSQDIVADAMNQIMNSKRARKSSVKFKFHSKVLLSVLAIGKLRGYIENYKVDGNELEVNISENLNACLAVKPRYVVKVKDIERYVRRFLPAKNMGVLIISTSEGLMTHQTALEKGKGGCIVAYFY